MEPYFIGFAFMAFFLARFSYIAYFTTGKRNKRHLAHLAHTWDLRVFWAAVTASRWTLIFALGAAIGRYLFKV